MKLFIALTVLISFALADHHEHHHDHQYSIKTYDEIVKARKDCMDELKLSDEDKAHLLKYEYPDKDTIHKYVHCTSVKLEFFDDVHGFHLDHLVDQLGKDKDKTELRTKIKECLDKHPKESLSNEIWAYKTYKCFLDSHILDHIKSAVLSHSH